MSQILVDEFFGTDLLIDDEFTTTVLVNQIIDLDTWDKKLSSLLNDL